MGDAHRRVMSGQPDKLPVVAAWSRVLVVLGARAYRSLLLALVVIAVAPLAVGRSEEHTSELQSLMRISYAVFCLKKKSITKHTNKKIKQRIYESMKHTQQET